MIQENLHTIQTHIQEATQQIGRQSKEVTLLAVSKTQPIELIEELYNYGVRDFGENKVQELLRKQSCMPADTRWHMIGHLQRNKVKYIAPFIHCIHSVDSLRLAETINAEAMKCNRIIDILVEVNVAQEDSKFGISLDEVTPLVYKLSKLMHIRVVGLMTIAPYVEDSEQNRPIFRKLRQKSVDIATQNIDNTYMSVLSMGMSNDYIVAIEEGATIVRVGTSLFGIRNYNIKNE